MEPTAQDYDRMTSATEPFGSPRPTDPAAMQARSRAIDEGRLTVAPDPALERARREEAAENERQRLATEAEAIERGRRLGLIPPAPAAPPATGAAVAPPPASAPESSPPPEASSS